MKKLKFIKNMLFLLAVFSARTPSQFGTYNPKCPEGLKTCKKAST